MAIADTWVSSSEGFEDSSHGVSAGGLAGVLDFGAAEVHFDALIETVWVGLEGDEFGVEAGVVGEVEFCAGDEKPQLTAYLLVWDGLGAQFLPDYFF